MSLINYNMNRLLDMHCVIGALQTSAILGRNGDSAYMESELKKPIMIELESYAEAKRKAASLSDTAIIEDLFASYRKMLDNALAHDMPEYLNPFYNDIVTELNAIIDELATEDLLLEKFASVH